MCCIEDAFIFFIFAQTADGCACSCVFVFVFVCVGDISDYIVLSAQNIFQLYFGFVRLLTYRELPTTWDDKNYRGKLSKGVPSVGVFITSTAESSYKSDRAEGAINRC